MDYDSGCDEWSSLMTNVVGKPRPRHRICEQSSDARNTLFFHKHNAVDALDVNFFCGTKDEPFLQKGPDSFRPPRLARDHTFLPSLARATDRPAPPRTRHSRTLSLGSPFL